MEEIVSKLTIEVVNGNVIIQPIHVLNPDAADYPQMIFSIEQLMNEKVELRHDGFSNWKKYTIPK